MCYGIQSSCCRSYAASGRCLQAWWASNVRRCKILEVYDTTSSSNIRPAALQHQHIHMREHELTILPSQW